MQAVGQVTALRVVTVKGYFYTCERCGYKGKAFEEPKRCGKCRSPYWNIPRGTLKRGRLAGKKKPRTKGSK